MIKFDIFFNTVLLIYGPISYNCFLIYCKITHKSYKALKKIFSFIQYVSELTQTKKIKNIYGTNPKQIFFFGFNSFYPMRLHNITFLKDIFLCDFLF
jgi:hypothetical protein